MQRAFDRLGGPEFDAADHEFAARIQATLSKEDILSAYRRQGIPVRPDTPLCDWVIPREMVGEPMLGSTDVGDVSWAVPTVQARIATHAIGTPLHTWQVTAQGKVPAAHKGMVYAAKVMAATAIEALRDPAVIVKAKEDHQRRLAESPYVCPIPDDVKPPVQQPPAR
jgi:aminobenzoyl-glutamate utilization protein B